MANRLQSWIFIVIALIIMGWGMIPVVRFAFGLDAKLTGSYIWSLSFVIGGLMCGLTAMLLMVRKQPNISRYLNDEFQQEDKLTAAKIHASGLLILTGVPLLNFLACYYLWLKNRGKSKYLDTHGREAICFQISIYLYLLMCLFMAYIIIGAIVVPLILLFHVLATVSAICLAVNNSETIFRYPANITIIDRFLKS